MLRKLTQFCVRRRPPSVFAPLGRRRDAAERAADRVAAAT